LGSVPSTILQTIKRSVIQVSGVGKTYGQTVAVDEVSFEVNEGEIFGLIGPNGAGETTTMECIEGLRTPDRGTISVLGLDPFRQVYKVQDRIGVQLQQAQLQKRIKVWEAVDLWASGGLSALVPMGSFPIRRRRTRHTTERFGEVTLVGKTVLYSDVGERVIAVQ
jgi:ABC-type multidrug transport system ATPase subunit